MRCILWNILNMYFMSSSLGKFSGVVAHSNGSRLLFVPSCGLKFIQYLSLTCNTKEASTLISKTSKYQVAKFVLSTPLEALDLLPSAQALYTVLIFFPLYKIKVLGSIQEFKSRCTILSLIFPRKIRFMFNKDPVLALWMLISQDSAVLI